MAHFGKRSMKDKIQSNLVTLKEVDDFSQNFKLIICSFCALMVVFSLIGGNFGIRLGGLLSFFACIVFLVWLWFFRGIKLFVLFGPFFNLPLKNEKRVRIIATALVLYLAFGNLSAVFKPQATNKAFKEMDAAIRSAH